MKGKKLTSWEWDGFNNPLNVSNGHAHQEQNEKQLQILENLGQLYLDSERAQQKELEEEFAKLFFQLGGQDSYIQLNPPMYHYAASLSIEAVGNYLRLQNMSVGLIEPTFDNLADILKRHKVDMKAIEEDDLFHLSRLDNMKLDALFLVCPNNPTGLELTQEQVKDIVDYCKKRNLLLIIDFSFRFHSSYVNWDQYKMIQDAGIEFIFIEDTGKTWPTLDLKMGILVASDKTYEALKDVTNDFILNVSPFVVKLLIEYLKAEKGKGDLFVQENVATNRKYLREQLKGTPLTIANPATKLSVEWIAFPSEWDTDTFTAWLEKYNVYILPGAPFYWNKPERGEKYIRVALARQKDYFETAAQRLRKYSLLFAEELTKKTA